MRNVVCLKTQRSRESRHRRNIWQCTKGGSRLRSPASLDFRPLRRRLVLSVSSSRSNHSRKRPVEIRTSCQPQNALSEFHRPSPTAQSTHATENTKLTCRAVDWKEECFFLP